MSLLFEGGPRIRPEEFRLLRDLVRGHCGIAFQDDGAFLLERRLRERVQALGLDDFKAYYRHLRYHDENGQELERAVDLLTTNETYFFREDYQLRGFAEEILPILRRRALRNGRRRLSLWSAGCSTGEEAYTLGMLVARTKAFEDWDVRIFGSDISRSVLKTAREGVYQGASFRAMPDEYWTHFDETPGGYAVRPSIRAMCHFGHLNLLNRHRATIVGRVDAIFCRNVLIYFREDARRQVIETFYERLVPGGYLCLGHSESLLNLSTAFELVHMKTDLVYRKPDSRASIPPGEATTPLADVAVPRTEEDR